MRVRWYEKGIDWFNTDNTVTNTTNARSMGDESYLALLRPETLDALETWRKKNNGNQDRIQ
jgi:hypothetical protein